MNKCRTIAFLLALVILVTSFSAFTTKATGPLFKVTFRDNGASRSDLEAIGATIVEDYGSYVLANIDPSYVSLLTEKGHDLILCADYNTVTINGMKLHPDQNKNLIPEVAIPQNLTLLDTNSPEGYFLIQFIGPIKESWKNDIKLAGADILGYYNTNAMLVKIDSNSIFAVTQHGKVQGATPYFPAFKIDPGIKPGNDGKALISILLHQDKTARSVISRVSGEIVRMTGEDSNYIVASVAMDKILQIAILKDVAFISNYVEPEPTMDFSREILGVERRTLNSSTPLNPASRGLWDEGLKGEGEVVAIQDTGLDTGNVATVNTDFEAPTRLVQHFGYLNPTGPDPNSTKPWNDSGTPPHGTFCLSQIAGNGGNSGGQYSGIAPKAKYVVQRGLGWLNPGLPDAYRYGARVHSNSWGAYTGGIYDTSVQYLDDFVFKQPDQVVTVSSGNGFSNIGTPSIAKNCIGVGAAGNNKPWRTINSVVGNTLNTGTTQPTAPPMTVNFNAGDWICITGATPAETEFRQIRTIPSGVTVNTIIFTGAPLTFPHPAGSRVFKNSVLQLGSFSSQGPSADGRIKPDVCGPGVDITAVRAFTSGYEGGWNGTSMSNPSVAGIAALTRQWLKQKKGNLEPSAALVKALLINGARPMQYKEFPSWSTTTYPDNAQGWGYVDGYATLYPTAPTTRKFWDYKRGISNGQRIDIPIVAGPGKLKVSLVWSDPAAVPNANPALINDLDLVVNSPGNQYFYRGNAFTTSTSESTPNPPIDTTSYPKFVPDTLNNVEGVTLNNSPYSGLYTVSVFGSNIPQGPQPFALVIQYEATLPDFEIVANPNSQTANTNMTNAIFPFTVRSLKNFLGTVELSIKGLPSEFQSQLGQDFVNLSAGVSELNLLELIKKFNLKAGKYYITIRGESQGIWHEEEVELIIRPGQDYKFSFGKGVNLDNIGSFGDDGVTANPGQKLYYSLSYDAFERSNFNQLYVDDKIPAGTSYTNMSFPNPTHYSLDGGNNWTNATPPANIGSSCTLRWALHEIDGNGRMQKISTGTPGFENLSNNQGTSVNSIHKFDTNGNIHVVWADDSTFNQEVYYRKWNGTAWVDLAGNPGFSNISNTTTSESTIPDMTIDSNGFPHFTWLEYFFDATFWTYRYSVPYTRWNGTDLVNATGTPGFDNISSSINNTYLLVTPRLALHNNNATVSFGCQRSGFRNIYITRWNGTAWSQMDGITPGLQIAAPMGTIIPNQIAMGLETNGNPIIVVTVNTTWFFWSFPFGICATKWNGTAWTQMDNLTPGFTYIAPTSMGSDRSYPSIAMQGDIPHIVWSDASVSGNNDIYYTKWVNGAWYRADGVTAGRELVSNSNLVDRYPHIAINNNGVPAVVWSNSTNAGPADVLFRQYKNVGWTGFIGASQIDKITDNTGHSAWPHIEFDSNNLPCFSFMDNFPGNPEIFITYPNMNYTNINFPGQIIWGAKIDQNIPSGVSAITNIATMHGIVDTLSYYVKTGTSFDQTVNPLSKGIIATISANPSTVAIGDEIKFTVTISNTGKAIVDGINATFLMPSGLVFVRAKPTAIVNQGKINWKVGSLGAGQSVTYLVYCKVTNQEYQGRTMSTKLAVTSNGLPTIEKYSTFYVSKSGGGFPAADFSFKMTGSPVAGQETEFTLIIESGNGPYSYKIEWGDNSNESANAAENTSKIIKHTFANSGKYTITVSITDRYGVTSVKHIKVRVK
jgi:uncharacterized repeat protein (TIGR01451 family)